jgi:hypothetical protein
MICRGRAIPWSANESAQKSEKCKDPIVHIKDFCLEALIHLKHLLSALITLG